MIGLSKVSCSSGQNKEADVISKCPELAVHSWGAGIMLGIVLADGAPFAFRMEEARKEASSSALEIFLRGVMGCPFLGFY